LKVCLVFLHHTLSPNKIYLYDTEMSGLVKTPRVVVRDDAVPDAKTYKSRLYHIYNDPEVKDHLNRRARAHEPLPDLVLNAYYLLGYDWRETAQEWEREDEAEEGDAAPARKLTRSEQAKLLRLMVDTIGRVLPAPLSSTAQTLGGLN
jgi:hypothetical protein